MKRKLWHWLLPGLLAVLLTFGSTAYAFTDIGGHPAEKSIESLAQNGVVSGVSDDEFAPNGHVTAAQAVSLIVRGLKLNIDHMRFNKEPKASDYFEKVKDDAWYAQAFIIASLNGVPVPKDVDPEQVVTREEFAHWLMQAVMRTGSYAFIEIFLMIADEEEIDPNYMNSIQKLLVAKIVKLEEKQRFRPKQDLTRGEAAIWLDGAIKFVQKQKEYQNQPAPPTEPSQQDEVALKVDAVTEAVNKVTLTWGVKPNSGYRISVRGIEFRDNGEAVILYELLYPQPDHSYLTVITEPKAVTYIPADRKPILKPWDGARVGETAQTPASSDSLDTKVQRAGEEASVEKLPAAS